MKVKTSSLYLKNRKLATSEDKGPGQGKINLPWTLLSFKHKYMRKCLSFQQKECCIDEELKY